MHLFGLVILAIIAVFFYVIIKKPEEEKPVVVKPPPTLNLDWMVGFSEVTALDLLPNSNGVYWSYLDEMAARGFNLTRLWLMDVWHDKPHPIEYKEFTPYKILRWENPDVPVYDLEQWNDEFFNKLKQFVNKCRALGIIVIITLFDDCGLRYPELFRWHPYNPKNNIQHWFGSGQYSMYDTGEPMAMYVEEKLIDKVMKEIGNYDNIIWEYANEPYHDNNSWAEKIKSIVEVKHGKAGMTLYENYSVSAYKTKHGIDHPSRIQRVYRNHIYSGDGCRTSSAIEHYKLLLPYLKQKKAHHEHYFCFDGNEGSSIITRNGELNKNLLKVIDEVGGTGRTTI